MVEFSIALLRKCDAAIHVVDVVNGRLAEFYFLEAEVGQTAAIQKADRPQRSGAAGP